MLIEQFPTVAIKQVSYPNIPEFNKKIKLKYEKEVVGTYVSGHPLEDEIERFNSFNLTSDMLEVQNATDGEQEEDENQQFYGADIQDGMKVVCGGIISEVKKVFTKNGNREMAFVKVEDLVGDIDVMVFPALLEKKKPNFQVDNLVTIHGKLSLRDGEAPIVLCEDVQIWEKQEDGTQEAMDLTKENLPPAQKLYLKYSTRDNYKSQQIMNILAGHAGDSEVIVKCSETGVAGRLGIKVRISEDLLSELKGELEIKNIVVR